MIIMRERESDNEKNTVERVFKDIEGLNTAKNIYQAVLEMQARRWKEEVPERLFIYNI